MIFDTERMVNLRAQYQGAADYRVPPVVLLDRAPDLSGERHDLERLIRLVPTEKRKDLLGKFLNADGGQHIGAWFELMLLGWLLEQEKGAVEVEPEVEGCLPDFLLKTGSSDVIIEAAAYLDSSEEHERSAAEAEIWTLLQEIDRPYQVFIDDLELGGELESTAFTDEVVFWLDHHADAWFEYSDEAGNSVTLRAFQRTNTEHLVVDGPSRTTWVNPEPLKAPLRKKAGQHQAIRRAGYPYVIALFLQPFLLSAEEVAEAWLGREQVVYDIEKYEIVTVRSDLSGQHFYGREIQHKSVSGTLVFKAEHSAADRRRRLRAWYVQNPYADMPVDPHLFDVTSRYLVVGKDRTSFQMAWRQNQDLRGFGNPVGL